MRFSMITKLKQPKWRAKWWQFWRPVGAHMQDYEILHMLVGAVNKRTYVGQQAGTVICVCIEFTAGVYEHKIHFEHSEHGFDYITFTPRIFLWTKKRRIRVHPRIDFNKWIENAMPVKA